MRTLAQEAAFLVVLKYGSKEVMGGAGVSIYMIFGEGGGPCNQAHILQKFDASLEAQTSPQRILVLF